MRTIAIVATLLLSNVAHADALTEACEDEDVPTEVECASEPEVYADSFCALLTHEPRKAIKQLSKALVANRTLNNPNRYYFDPRTGAEPGTYIQLLRPWMKRQNADGVADWRVLRRYGGCKALFAITSLDIEERPLPLFEVVIYHEECDRRYPVNGWFWPNNNTWGVDADVIVRGFEGCEK